MKLTLEDRTLLVRAENISRQLAAEFNSLQFTDRHQDGPHLFRLAEDIRLRLMRDQGDDRS